MFDNTVSYLSLVYTSAGIEINTNTNKVAKAYFCSLVAVSAPQRFFRKRRYGTTLVAKRGEAMAMAVDRSSKMAFFSIGTRRSILVVVVTNVVVSGEITDDWRRVLFFVRPLFAISRTPFVRCCFVRSNSK